MKRIVIKTTAVILALCVLAALPVAASDRGEAAEAMASVSAESYVLMDGDTAEVLAASHPDTPLPMASTTKIMTALLAVESGRLAETVTVSPGAVGTEGSSVYLVLGEKIVLEDLVYALLLESANDAAVAIACHLASTPEAFADQMNAKAEIIGMTATHFVNPHGLPAEGHVSTARDLALLLKYAVQNELFCEICGTVQKTIPAPQGARRYLSNHNRLLRSYPSCIAGKTGYTKAAGRCLVTAARENGKTLVCATLNDPSDWQDHKSLYAYGFSQYTASFSASPGQFREQVPTIGAEEESVTVTNREGFTIPLREGQTVRTAIECSPFLFAPKREADSVGAATFYLNGQKVGSVPLYPEKGLVALAPPPTFWQKIILRIRTWLHL